MTNGRRSRCRCTKTSATGRHENNVDRACLVAGGLEERKAQCFAGVVIPTFLQAATSAASFALHLPAVSKWPDFEDRHVQPLRFARKQLTCPGEHGPIGKQSIASRVRSAETERPIYRRANPRRQIPSK